MSILKSKYGETATGFKRFLATVFIVCLYFCCCPFTKGDDIKEILVLHSYDLNTTWVRDVMEGIESTLEQYEGNIKIDVEYMDARRIRDEKHFENLLALYKHKANFKNYETVITVNNDAIQFLLKHRSELYPGVPIVFCGVSSALEYLFSNEDMITGAMSAKMLHPTLDAALKLHPSASKVYFICYTRKPRKKQLMKEYLAAAQKRFYGRAEFIERRLAEPSVEELIKAIDGLGSESIVIFTGLYKDKQGNRYIFKDAYDSILEHCKAPIYVLSKQWFGFAPVVGGCVNSGFHQGQAAARMTLRILNGEKPEDIPIIRSGLDKYIFDYAQLKRFGIGLSKLPAGSIVINKPESFYYLYKEWIWAVTTVICILTLLVLILSANILRRKRAELKLLEYQRQLKNLASKLSLTEERERRRIATQLHDEICQSLVISKLKLDAICQKKPADGNSETLREVRLALDDAVKNSRSLTSDLSFPVLYELGLEAAVSEWLDEQIGQKYGISTEFFDDGREKILDDDIRAILFRNVKELLINVVKHARASKIRVECSRVNEQVHISVQDDGVGFADTGTAAIFSSSGGFGIFSIKERLEQVGGRLEIESETDKGTKVTMIAPLKRQVR